MQNIIITRSLLDAITDYIYDFNSGNAELDVRDAYSGRGMYGSTCIGFVTDNPMFVLMAITAFLVEKEDAYNLHDANDAPFTWSDLRVAQDSMGLSSIVYLPNLQVEASSKEYREWISS